MEPKPTPGHLVFGLHILQCLCLPTLHHHVLSFQALDLRLGLQAPEVGTVTWSSEH
jgi:hypothetical protein